MNDEEQMRQAFAAQRQIHAQQRASMEEVVSELRQDLLRDGADPKILREYELNVIDLAFLDGMGRTMDQREQNMLGG